MVFNVSLDHECHVKQNDRLCGLGRHAKSGVRAATQLLSVLLVEALSYDKTKAAMLS
jgi:hypothetical protein